MNRKNNNILFAIVICIVVVISIALAMAFAFDTAKDDTSFENDDLNDKSTEKVLEEEAQLESEQQIPVNEEPMVDEPSIEEPVIEEPVIDEPVVEEPVEEPVVEEKVEEKAEEKPTIEEPAKEEPEVQEKPQSEQSEMPQPAVTDVDGDWNLILANPWNKLPDDFKVQLAEIAGGHRVDARIVDDLDAMMKDMAKAGCSAFVCSSYRTHSKQTTLYNNEVADYVAQGYSREDAEVMAAKWVAIPGTSEHQTGLAVDIMSNHYLVLDEGQENTAEQKWLMENSYKYGFILRYPSNKSEITGINYEPWHYRYVGKEAAKEIYEKGICFEEYLLG